MTVKKATDTEITGGTEAGTGVHTVAHRAGGTEVLVARGVSVDQVVSPADWASARPDLSGHAKGT